jgi:hypothetical protein
MKRILQSAVLVAVLCGSVSAVDDLDAALAELKKKAQRRNYSRRAQLQEQGLTVPSDAAEKEQALDAQLQVMERKLQAEAPIRPPRPRARPLPRQEEDQNWLTPALLDDDAAGMGQPEDKNAWISKELERQKNIHLEKDALAKEQALIDRRVSAELKRSGTSTFNPASMYNRSLQDVVSGRPADRPQSPAQNYNRPTAITENPFAMNRSTTQPLFSPTAGQKSPERRTAKGNNQLFKIERKPLNTPSDFRSSWKQSSPEPKQPLKRLRKSTLDSDPFADDFAPRVNKSIWD